MSSTPNHSFSEFIDTAVETNTEASFDHFAGIYCISIKENFKDVDALDTQEFWNLCKQAWNSNLKVKPVWKVVDLSAIDGQAFYYIPGPPSGSGAPRRRVKANKPKFQGTLTATLFLGPTLITQARVNVAASNVGWAQQQVLKCERPGLYEVQGAIPPPTNKYYKQTASLLLDSNRA